MIAIFVRLLMYAILFPTWLSVVFIFYLASPRSAWLIYSDQVRIASLTIKLEYFGKRDFVGELKYYFYRLCESFAWCRKFEGGPGVCVCFREG